MSVSPSDLTGLFKAAYGESTINLIPEVAKLIRMVPFISKEKQIGDKYHQPVVVSYSHGVTYGAANAGAYSLNAAVALAMQDAQVDAPQITLRESVGYDAAAKAAKGRNAFMDTFDLLVETMMESMMKRVEIASWYGGTGIGQVSSSANTNATTSVVQLSTATWATGIWSGMKNCKINFYDNTATLVSSSTDSIFVISSVDVANRKLTVTGTATGITALDSKASTNAPLDIYFNGAKASEMSGINTIITNTGTLFNISASDYELWKGNTYSAASAALTMGKAVAAVAKAVQLGLNEKVCLFVNPATWTNLNSDLAALRRFDGSWRKAKGENGQENISYYGQNGEIELISHNIIKEGEAFAVPLKRIKRLGAQDVSFKTPGREDEIFLHLPDNNGYELRNYTDQQIFIETPARTVKITSIVNS